MFVDGHAGTALIEADRIARLLALRAGVTGAVAIVPFALFGGGEWVLGVVCAAGIALSMSVQSGYISVHRASGELLPLARAALARTLLALLLAALGAAVASWPGAMAGEIVAALIGGWIGRTFVARTVRAVETVPLKPIEPVQKEFWLFVAVLIGAVPVYLDRAFVSVVFGTHALGSYGVLMLFVTGAFTLVTIIVQALGPQLVKLEHRGASLRSQLGMLLGWTAAASIFIVSGMVVASMLLLHGPIQPLGTKYSLDLGQLLATTALAMLQVSLMFDWMLISHDRERPVFLAALIYLLVLAGGVGVFIQTLDGIEQFMWIMAGAKLAQVVIQLVFIALIPAANRSLKHTGETLNI
jgi:hypothetical protein